MRIQNNITAMNTHRMYTINNDNVAKSAEKLSSGYRINRAGDDAAGLAISEKMRAQIRGLNMATKNSQDAISLVQTAEGALQETHSMLQRMNELAVQAATGTNEGFDRTQAAKEFEQLKREINDVAEQTNFNNMKILDGSLSYEGYIRSAATAGVTSTVQTDATAPVEAITVEATKTAQAETPGVAGTLQVTSGTTANAGWTQTINTAAADSPKQNHQVIIKIDGKEVTATKGAGGPEAIYTDSNSNTIGALIGTTGVNFEYDGVQFQLDNSGKISTLDSTGGAGVPAKDFDMSRISIELKSFNPDTPGTVATKTYTFDATQTVNAMAATGAADAVTAAETTITLDPDKIQDGDSVTVGGKTFTFYAKDAAGKAYDADGNEVTAGGAGKQVNVLWDPKTDGDLGAQFLDALKGTTGTAYAGNGIETATPSTTAGDVNISVAGNGNTITLTAQGVVATGGATAADDYEDNVETADKANKAAEVTTATASANTEKMKTTVEFDVAKMKEGDKFTIKAGNTKIEVEFNGETRAKFMDKVAEAVTKAGADSFASVKGNALIIDDKTVDIKLDWNTELNDKTNAIRIQVGANENEQLALSIDSMNTAGLGLDDAFLTVVGQSTDENIDSAGAAITAVKAAINKVSDQRATLGAMQNRLDHKIANLKVSSENLSAAESRIRDVDMASEMTNFTKNNILSQAATAMLAQANALPQNVLSLLG